MHGFQIIGLDQADAWRSLWQELPLNQRDVFAHPDYYAANAMRTNAVAECATLKTDRGLILYPYLREPIHTIDWLEIDEPCFDLTGAYGFGGPLGKLDDARLWDEFTSHFHTYCKQTNIIAEFVRVHPLLRTSSAMSRYYDLKLANFDVVVDLQQEDERLWKSYKHNNRKNINKALRSGVKVFHDLAPFPHFDSFLQVYHRTLDRREAKEFYHFPRSFYEHLHRNVPEMLVYFFAEHDGQIVSCELCLISPTTIYSFLGGTEVDRFDVRPNNLLKHELIRWGRDRGLKYYLIGGGYQMNDGIFEYKKSFAPQGIVEFEIATKVHCQARYSALCQRCENHHPYNSEAARRWFLRWRYEA